MEPCYLMVKPKNYGRLYTYVRRAIHKYFKVKFYQAPDIEANAVSKKKNEIMMQVAKELSLPWCDINAYLDSTYFIRRDHIHYEYMASPYICRYLINFMNKIISNEKN